MKLAWDLTGRDPVLSWRTAKGHHRRVFSGEFASVSLLPAIRELLEGEGEPLDMVGTVRGPGSFTGIRSGLMVAAGFRVALGVPALGFSHFELLADAAGAGTHHLVLSARPGYVYYANYRDGVCLSPPAYLAIDDLPKGEIPWSSAPVPGLEVRVPAAPPTDLCLEIMDRAAHNTGRNGQGSHASHPLEPLYIRPADTRKSPSLLATLLGEGPPRGG